MRFSDLLIICESSFGIPLIVGEHYIFETPWRDDPLLSIQSDGLTTKPYQVKMIRDALERMEADYDKQQH